MKKILKFLISLVIGLVIFLIVMQKVGLGNIKEALLLFFQFEGWVIILLTFVVACIGIFRWKLVLGAQGHRLSFKKLSPLWLVGFSMSYLTPVAFLGGEFFRIFFTTKKIPAVPVKKTVASVVVDRILDATVFFIFLIAGMLAFAFYGSFPTSIMGISIIVVALLLLGLLLFFYFKRFRRESILEWFLKTFKIKSRFFSDKNGVFFEAEKEVFHFFSLKHKAFYKALLLTLLRYGLLFLRCAILVLFLVGNIGVFKSLAIYGFANLAGLAPIPATLGALELGEGFAFGVLGLGFGTGTIFSMVWRAADLLLALIGLVFLIKFGTRVVQDKVLKVFEKKQA